MATLIFLWRHSKSILVLAFLTSILGGAGSVALVALLQSVIVGKWQANSITAVLFVMLCLLVLGARVGSQLLTTYLSQRATFHLMMRLCSQIVATPLTRLEEIGPSRLTALLTDDVTTLVSGLGGLPNVLTQGTVVALCVVYMMWMSVHMALIVVVLLIGSSIALYIANRWTLRFFTSAWSSRNSLFGHILSLIEGIKELKLHQGRRKSLLEDVIPCAARSYERNNLYGVLCFNFGASTEQLLIFGAIAIAAFALPHWYTVDRLAINGFMIVLIYLMIPLEGLISALPALSRSNIALQQLTSLHLSESTLIEQKQHGCEDVKEGEELLSLKGVVYGYSDSEQEGQFVVGPINLSIRRGEILFLIGGNGSGKTTLAKILTGLYAPERGRICLNGTVITEETSDAYRQNFSAIFQQCYLFEDLLGIDQSMIDGRSKEYLSLFRLAQKVSIENNRFSTLHLSAGERKRLALLTAFLEDRPIYLFDEWAADQEPWFRHLFYHQIVPDLRKNGKTVIIISHDDRYFGCGTRVIELDQGLIVSDTEVSDAKEGTNPLVSMDS